MFTSRQFRNRYALHCQMLRTVQRMKSETGQVQKKQNLNQPRKRKMVRTLKLPLVWLRARVENTRILPLPRAQLSHSRPTFGENARESLLSRAASLKKRACSQASFSMTIKILHFEHTLFISSKNKLCSLPAKCSRIQIFEIIELNSVVSGAVTCK